MEDGLPENFDLIVIGTGLPESVLAAGAARVGKTVLHLDSNEFYGGLWTSFNLESFQSFVATIDSKDNSSLADDFQIDENSCGIEKTEQIWHIHESSDEETDVKYNGSNDSTSNIQINNDEAINIENISQGDIDSNKKEWTREKIEKEFRRFNIDLSPKLLYSCGELVKLLISSNICRYAEFRAVDHVCAKFNKTQIRTVPCSRSDVFNSKDLTVIEKRLLMKLLNQCMSYENDSQELKQFKDKTFVEFLKANRLTEKIIHYVSDAISLSNDTTSFEIGMGNALKFLQSLGRYGDTPFLFPMYGSGEIPQCFCRLCAVFGGIYCLKKSIDNIVFAPESNSKKVVGINIGGRTIKSENIVIGCGHLPRKFIALVNQNAGMARAILIASKPIGDTDINSNGGGVNFLRLSNGESHALVLHLSHFSGCCPKGLYLIHITTLSISGDPKKDCKPFVDQLLELEYPPKIEYSAYFLIPMFEQAAETPENLFITNGPFYEIDYDKSLENAKSIFGKLYPSESFLPRAPDPEEIVIGDEDPTEPKCDDALGLLKQSQDMETKADKLKE